MKLEQILEVTNYAVSGGGEYLWQCYPDAHIMDFDFENATVGVVFSTKNQEVYEVSACTNEDTRYMYRWLNPDFKEAMFKESDSRGIDQVYAMDEIKWMDTDTESDILEKLSALVNNEPVDPTVEIKIDFSDDELLRCMIKAHEMDMTFNDFCNLALAEFVKSYEKELNDNP
jgi:hypothetical protein